MIRFMDVKEDAVRRLIPGTLKRVFEHADEFAEAGYDIVIRDTDHPYDALRIYPHSETADNDRYYEFCDLLSRIITSTCCKCGTTKDVEDRPVNDKSNCIITRYLCPECLNRTHQRINMVSRLLTDSYGRRVTDGDIIMAIDDDDRPFWGLILNIPVEGICNERNRLWNNYSLIRGQGSELTSLARAKRFMVVDNCGLDHYLYAGIKFHQLKYEFWVGYRPDFKFEEEAKQLIGR